jgi:ACT domain-containing protein
MKQGTRVVISVMGRNSTGIMSAVTGVLSDKNVDIVDITQKIVEDLFLMMIVADLPLTGVTVEQLHHQLGQKCSKFGLQTVVQHEKLFKYMHRV